MAKSEGRSTEEEARQQLRHYRRVVANAVGFVRSREINDSFTSFSLEEAVDQHISRLEGGPEDTRPSRIDQIDRIKQDLDNAIEGIKETDPDMFMPPDNTQDVNTSPDSEET